MATTALPELSAIGALVLTRLLPAGEKGETAAKIRTDLEPLLLHRWSGVALAEQVERTIGELEANGLATFLRGKTKKSAPKLLPTPEGRRLALAFLGIDELKPKTTWATLRKLHLPAQALGLTASTDASIKAIASDPGFKAMMLKQQFHLPAALPPKLDDILDALAWKLIGFEGSARKFAIKAVKTALFNRELGNGRETEFKKAASQLLARRIGARRDDSKELRDAIVRGWIDEHSNAQTGAADAHRGPASLIAAPQVELDLPAFADRVKAAAGMCTTGRYGSNKVFVAHVFMALQSDPLFQNMSLGEFKDRLAQANNARLLDLSRADLVQAMDPDDVRQSEVQYLSATFHFVRI
ncbi:MAG: hypothetical protein ACLQIB_43465 [Isosphaeraceae bacterium]